MDARARQLGQLLLELYCLALFWIRDWMAVGDLSLQKLEF
jgi:hypothetical protein